MATMLERPGDPRFESLLLGSITSEPVIVEGRDIAKYQHVDPETQSGHEFFRLTQALGLPDIVKMDASLIWRRARKFRGKHDDGCQKASYVTTKSMCVYIAARVHGRNLEPETVLRLGGTRRKGFVFHAHKLAQDLGLDLPRCKHDVDVLRMVDELGVDRAIMQRAKALYPKARAVHGGDPRSTMGALIYLLAKESMASLRSEDVAARLGLSAYTIRGVARKIQGELFRETTDPAKGRADRLGESKERLKRVEMRRMTADLLNLGLTGKRVYWLLRALHPEMRRCIVHSIVRRQSVRIASSPRGPD